MKRGKKTILMLAVLVILLGGYFGVQQLNKTESVSETEGTFALTDKTAADVTGLSWEKDGVKYSFTYTNDTWNTTDTPAWPVLQSTVQTMADTLGALQGTRKLEDVKSLGDYGLETPAFSVTATWQDGTKTTYSMGDETPFADGYYLSLSNQEGIVYTVASSLADTFDKTQKDMVAMESIPTVSDVTEISVGSTFHAVKKEESLTVDPDQLWYTADTQEPLEGSDVQSLITSAKAIAWDELVTANATEDALTEWQLEEANATTVALKGGEESLSVLIGKQTDSGDYYARLPGSAMVYTVTASSLSSLLTASAEDMWIEEIMPLPYEQLASAVFTTQKGSYELVKPVAEAEATEAEATEAEATEAEATEAEATETETTEATEADETADAEEEAAEEARKNLWQSVTELKATEKSSAQPTGDMVLEITANDTAGHTVSVAFYEYTAEEYLAVTNGSTAVTVEAAKIDTLVRTVRTMG